MSRQSDAYVQEVLDRNINRIREYFTEDELKDKENFMKIYQDRFSTDSRGQTFLETVTPKAFWEYMQIHGTEGGYFDTKGRRILRTIHPDDGTYKFKYAEGTTINGKDVSGKFVDDITKTIPQSFLKEQKVTRHTLKSKQVVMRYAKGTKIEIKGKMINVGGRFAKFTFAMPKAIMQKFRIAIHDQPIMGVRRGVDGTEREFHKYRKGAMRKGKKVGGQFVPKQDRRGGEWWMEE